MGKPLPLVLSTLLQFGGGRIGASWDFSLAGDLGLLRQIEVDSLSFLPRILHLLRHLLCGLLAQQPADDMQIGSLATPVLIGRQHRGQRLPIFFLFSKGQLTSRLSSESRRLWFGRQGGTDQFFVVAGKDMAIRISRWRPRYLSARKGESGFQQTSAADLLVTLGSELPPDQFAPWSPCA